MTTNLMASINGSTALWTRYATRNIQTKFISSHPQQLTLALTSSSFSRRVRNYHHASNKHPEHLKYPASSLGFAFDIDGVLLKGKKVLKQGHNALNLLNKLKIPYILLTNGGGVTEAKKAEELSHKFKTTIHPHQVVLAHSPMHALAEKYADLPVLIIGKDECLDVALSYGFKRPVLADHIYEWNPSIWPFRDPRHKPLPPCDVDFNTEPIAAVLVFHDSRDWGRDIQIMCDIARSQGGMIGTMADKNALQAVPFYFSNSDFLWSNDFPVNRFAAGAVRLAMETLYEELCGQRLSYTRYGKPEHPTYVYADRLLKSYANELWPNDPAPCRTIYAVGDNPASDIHVTKKTADGNGANKHGWNSILVRTGVWKEDLHGHSHGAKHVVHDVEEAVHMVIQKELL